jgi:hypothetical protein
MIIAMEKQLKRRVIIYPVSEYHIEQFNIIELLRSAPDNTNRN